MVRCYLAQCLIMATGAICGCETWEETCRAECEQFARCGQGGVYRSSSIKTGNVEGCTSECSEYHGCLENHVSSTGESAIKSYQACLSSLDCADLKLHLFLVADCPCWQEYVGQTECKDEELGLAVRECEHLWGTKP